MKLRQIVEKLINHSTVRVCVRKEIIKNDSNDQSVTIQISMIHISPETASNNSL